MLVYHRDFVRSREKRAIPGRPGKLSSAESWTPGSWAGRSVRKRCQPVQSTPRIYRNRRRLTAMSRD